MRRMNCEPRPDWQTLVESDGFIFHSLDGAPYWDETVHYQFSGNEIAELEQATAELQRLCLQAGDHIIAANLFERLGIPTWIVPLIKQTWEQEPPAIYGRFDLAYDGRSAPKLLEYNADTPTSLYEAAVVQWNWLQDVRPSADQFNSIHERLIAKWEELRNYAVADVIHFAHCNGSVEDMITVGYLQETAQQAGFRTVPMVMEQIGWNDGRLVDLSDQSIETIFKLYPWEWLVHEADQAGRRNILTVGSTAWMEPIWKMLWSNKGLLPVLWELFPGHPNLLPAYFDHAHGMEEYVSKPLLSREGANVTVVRHSGVTGTDGDYGEEGLVYQALAPIPEIDGNCPVIGSWVIDGQPAGMGIRESRGPITDNLSRFVPHMLV